MDFNVVCGLRSQFLAIVFSLPITLLHAQQWSQVTTSGGFSARTNASAVYNSNDNSIVVYGGETDNGFTDDLWRLDLDTYSWTEITVEGNKPFPRHTADALFDAEGNRMLLYSGQGTGGLANDVWSFDFNTLEWTELNENSSASGQPSKRYGTISVLDEQEDRIVAFAGFASVGSRQDDTWAFDLSNNSWQELGPDPHPLQRCLHRGTLVDDQRIMIAYGGQSGPPLGDIWAYDLDANTWTELTPDDSPPARLWSTVNYIGDNRLIVFGGNGTGQGRSSGVLADLWEFSLTDNTWTELTLTNGPPARDGHLGIFLPCTGEVLILTGSNSSGELLNDVWKLEGLVENTTETPVLEGLKAVYCTTEGQSTLTANPGGGTFTGDISPGGTFDPSALGEGTYEIAYTLRDGRGCEQAVSENTMVVAPSAAPEVSCTSSSTGSVTFNWTHPEASSFEFIISINGVPLEVVGTTTENAFIQDGLDPNDLVEISVVGLDINACGNTLMGTGSCNSQACPSITENVAATFCEGDLFEFAGMTYDAGGTYGVTLQTDAGCDSSIFLSLTELKNVEVQIDTSVASGTVVDDVLIASDTSWTVTLPATSGCDSVVVYTAVVLTTAVEAEVEKGVRVSLSPNPFSNSALLHIEGVATEVRTLNVYSTTGQLLRSHQFTTDQFVLERSRLPVGLYYYQVRDQGGLVGTGRFVVQ